MISVLVRCIWQFSEEKRKEGFHYFTIHYTWLVYRCIPCGGLRISAISQTYMAGSDSPCVFHVQLWLGLELWIVLSVQWTIWILKQTLLCVHVKVRVCLLYMGPILHTTLSIIPKRISHIILF